MSRAPHNPHRNPNADHARAPSPSSTTNPQPARRLDLLADETGRSSALPTAPNPPAFHPPPGVPMQTNDRASNRWLGVYFRCARQYTRVFRREGATNYTARCPTCGQTLSFQVDPHDPNATTDRFYQVTC